MTFLKPLNNKIMKANVWLGILLLSACSLQTTTPTPDLPPTSSVVPLVTVAETEAAVAEASESASGEPSLMPSLQASATNFDIGNLEKEINPLTGLPPSDLALLDRPPVAVKITSYPRSNRPQWGLSLADIVYEYYHNNELTRFHAIFYGQDADLAGPIRSARLPDEYLMNAYGSSLAYASADSRIRDALDSAFPSWRLVSIMEGGCPPNPVCRYDPEGFNHLLANTSAISEYIEAIGGNHQAPDLTGMQFSEQKPKSNEEVTRIYLRYSYADYSYWDYDEGQRNYLRYQDAWDNVGGRGDGYIQLTDRLNGKSIRAENIVVLYVNHFHFVYKAASNGLPATEIVDMDFEGRGQAYAFRNGLAYALEWVRKSDGVLQLEFDDGRIYDFKPGNTWFQIFNDDSKLDAEGDTWYFNFVFLRP